MHRPGGVAEEAAQGEVAGVGGEHLGDEDGEAGGGGGAAGD